MSTASSNAQQVAYTGAEALSQVFVEEGIRSVFLYPGGTIAPIVNACVERNIALEVFKSEQGAGFAAIAAARLTGRPQVVLVTSGPGVTNVLTPLADAFYDSTPVIFVTGQISSVELSHRLGVRQRGFQECPTVEVTKPICKWSNQALNATCVSELARSAFRAAVHNRPGPVVLDMPMDVQQDLVTEELSPEVLNGDDGIFSEIPAVESYHFSDIWAAIDKSRRPVILVGQGAIRSVQARDLEKLAELIDALVVSSLPGLGAFDSESPRFTGYIGHTGHWAANLAVDECDLLLVLGARLDLRQTGTEVNSFARKAQVVWVDIDQTELDEPRVQVWKSIRSDAGVFVSSLLQVLMTKNLENRNLIGTDREWQDKIRTAKRLRVDDDPKSFPTGTLHPRDILDEISRQIRDTSLTVVTGVGLHQQWAARHLPTSPAKVSFLTSSGHGTMGFDLPAAIGAALVAPNRRVLCVVGDGSLMMNIQELASLSERALDVKILLMNNQRLGIVSQFQLIRWGDDPSTGVFLGPDFSKVADGFGIPARTLESKTDIEASIEWLWQQQGPALLDARIAHDVDVVPMLLAGQTMGEMWMGHA